jgi:hypothetical protein
VEDVLGDLGGDRRDVHDLVAEALRGDVFRPEMTTAAGKRAGVA